MKMFLAVCMAAMVVCSIRLLLRCWYLEEEARASYFQGKRDGWYEAMSLIPGHGDSNGRSKNIWN